MPIKNEQLSGYVFLEEMLEDDYFPKELVKKGQGILTNLCLQIEGTSPKSLDELYALTHKSTEAFNQLEAEFDEQGSEIETAARECIASDFQFIANAYGFEADIEELIAPREW